uniref:Uncharacterized protein n=1 Tax=Ditylenchus dipsaci TaxID=166011 RepID=A0A915DBJ9_9BILA
MSSKHFRRFLSEQEAKEQEQQDEVSDEEPRSSKSTVNKFAFLHEGDESDEDKNVSQSSSSEEEVVEKTPSTLGSKLAAKKRKQKKKKGSQNDNFVDTLTLHIPDLTVSSDSQNNISQLMKIDPRSLNPDNELRKLLGKAFAGNTAPDNNNLRIAQAGRSVHRVIPGRMVKAKPEWPPIRQLGVFMSVEKQERGIIWYRFQHNEQYQLLQQHFWLYQKQMDHESILNSVLVKNPYHLDSLLLLAEIMRIQEDIQNSRDAIG